MGSTTESNTLSSSGGESLTIYMLKGDTDHVYTFQPGWSFLNEDGRTITIEDEWVRWSASNENTPVSSGMMIPRPNSIEGLVAQSHVIVLGTISSVLEEMVIGGYGEDGKPTPAGEEGGLPYTDYEVRIESVLKGDGALEDGGTLVLRMFGHLSNENAIITPNVFMLPNPGNRLLFALGRNPDGTYGSGPEGLLNVDGEKVIYADGVPFGIDISPEQLIQRIPSAHVVGTAKLVADCWYTEAEPLPLTFDVATEPTPTGFDGRNSAGCRFSKPISKVSVTLTNEDGSIHGQTFLIEPPSEDISFPLSKDLPSEMTLELLRPGEYRREMVAISEDGDAWDIVGNVEAALKTVTVEPRG